MRSRHGFHPKRLVLLVAVIAALTFAACAPRAHQPGGGFTGASGPASSQNVDTSGIQSTDQSVQSAIQSLQSAQNDADTDFSSQDTQTVP